MARVTVEDCIEKIPNRFKLVLLAAQRGRDISAGSALTVERDNDKNPVVALRELADQTVDIDELEENVIKSLQQYVEIDEPEEDELDLLAIQQETSGEVLADASVAPDAGLSSGIQFEDDVAAFDEAGDVFGADKG